VSRLETAVVLLTMVINAVFGVGGLARACFVRETSAQVRVPPSWLPARGAAKVAGAGGLAAGLRGATALGGAAAVGLTAFFVCAIIRHVQTGALRSIPFPGALLAVAAASLFIFVSQ
jgi:hypothetical protein